jgi:hypothetical protein
MILVCQLPQDDMWGTMARTTRILALITPCVTGGKDASVEITKYQTTTTSIITDIQTISCVVGRVLTRGKWGIIDRSGGLVKTEFIVG